jgi:hypothetical protein
MLARLEVCMKPFLFLLLAILTVKSFADDARIVAYNEPDEKMAVALDSKGIPRIDESAKTFPTIKTFRDDYDTVCYEGKVSDVKRLLKALVEAADGDGDSYARLKSIKVSNETIIVKVYITDESGKKLETMSFAPCSILLTAKCTVSHKERTHAITLKIEDGKIIPWDSKRWAKITPKKDSIFFWLGQDREESALEWEKSYRAKNGYSIVEVGTTADAVKVGVNLDEKKGFFKYEDLGSGNGNLELTLKCKEQKAQ